MNTIIKIALLHLLLLGSQAIYMFVSNKAQLIKRKYLYVLAIPFVAAFPAIIFSQDQQTYYIYEYAIVVCMIAAALADAAYATARNQDYMSDSTIRRFQYSFFFICMVCVCIAGITVWIKGVIVLILLGAFSVPVLINRHPVSELVRSLPLAGISVACSFALLYLAR